MATMQIDVRGAKCPIPVLRMTNLVMKKEVNAGDTLIVVADCPTFEKDVRQWCQSMKKTLIVLRDEGNNAKRAEVRIRAAAAGPRIFERPGRGARPALFEDRSRPFQRSAGSWPEVRLRIRVLQSCYPWMTTPSRTALESMTTIQRRHLAARSSAEGPPVRAAAPSRPTTSPWHGHLRCPPHVPGLLRRELHDCAARARRPRRHRGFPNQHLDG